MLSKGGDKQNFCKFRHKSPVPAASHDLTPVQGLPSCPPYPEEGVEGPVLHEFGDDHDRHAVGDDPVEADDVGVLKLAHDAGLAQEFPALLLRVAPFQGLDGHVDFLFPRHLQETPTDFAKLPCRNKRLGQKSKPAQKSCRKEKWTEPGGKSLWGGESKGVSDT